MINKKIAIIGAGNMGKAIVTMLIKKRFILAGNLYLTTKHSATDNKKVVQYADIIILAVKPQQTQQVLKQIKHVVRVNQLIISIAAGVKISCLSSVLSKNFRIVRVMPNIAVSVGQSMSCWVKNAQVSKQDALFVKKFLTVLGKEIELKDENLLDAVTAISGSGPAYIFYMIKLLEKAGLQLGLEKDFAKILARQTVIGSGKLLENSDTSIDSLIACVASKGGTTEKALQTFETGDLRNVFIKGIEAAYNRSVQLQKVLDKRIE